MSNRDKEKDKNAPVTPTAPPAAELTPAQAAVVARVQAILRPLAAVSLKGERRTASAPEGPTTEFLGVYHLTRSRRTVQITADDLRRLQAVVAAAAPSVAACRAALKPWRRLAPDARVESPTAPLFVLPTEEGPGVAVTNALIETIEQVAAELEEVAV
jgi:hypothetical protein